MRERLAWVDALKGLGMCFVIIGHMDVPNLIHRLIYSFHMPLFFAISGYLYNNIFSKKWILKKVDALLMMYLIWGGITLSVFLCVCKYEPLGGFKSLVSGNGIGVTWFLVCLFFVEVLGALIVAKMKCMQGLLQSILIISILGIIGYAVPLLGIKPICKSNTICVALSFWLFGYFLKHFQVRAIHLIFSLIFVPLFWIQRVDMNSAHYGNGFLFYGTALGFIIMFFFLFQRFSVQWKPLMFVGQRSLEFMCLHSIIPMLLTYGVKELGWDVSKLMMRIVSLSVVVFAAWGIHKYSKILSGRLCLFQKFAK